MLQVTVETIRAGVGTLWVLHAGGLREKLYLEKIKKNKIQNKIGREPYVWTGYNRAVKVLQTRSKKINQKLKV